MKQTILICSAHPDDEILGCGGTIAKYSKEGNSVISIIFSYGESSHPHLKKYITTRIRVKESQKADKIVGCKETIFLGLPDGKISTKVKNKSTREKIKKLIKKYKPDKIFTHSIEDPFPDHRAIYKLIIDSANEINYKGNLYSFDIWSIIRIKKRNAPKLIVDISPTFKLKLKALKCFKSQGISMFQLIPAVYARAIINGINYNHKFVEVFNKIK
ncbi:MAG: PIG-L family deacetylase [Nanoarchaeota archaeon]|nr:PIG-L family deacetylase [Nanoarchaeota archaeon]